MRTNRVEALSDGVFAIAVTLLVLDIRVPGLESTEGGAHLLSALGAQWPIYVAYVTSFLTILVMWVNHHRIFRSIRVADHTLLWLNGLLLAVTFVPFPTALIAEYLGHPGERVAAVVYAGTFVVLAAFFNLLWRYAASRRQLLHPGYVRRFSRQYAFGVPVYLVALILSFAQAWMSLALCLLLGLFFAVPVPWMEIERQDASPAQPTDGYQE